jgi:hypothetical protein
VATASTAIALGAAELGARNRLVIETLAARGIPFIDVSPCLEGRAAQYDVRGGHLRAAGHESVAACVGAFIAEQWSALIR